MKRLRYLICLAGVFTSIGLKAQNEVDALRYSMISFGGTARYVAMGGAYGSIGADISILSTNPGGIGLYRKNEFTITPLVYTGKTKSIYNNNPSEDIKYNFGISNIGFVSAIKNNKDKENGWMRINFGVGLNRYNNFHNRVSIAGDNKYNSLLDIYKTEANGKIPANLNPFSSLLTFNTYLIDTITASGGKQYSSVIENGGVFQNKVIESRGAMQEMVISLGGNYSDKLYLGATLGIPFIRYIEEVTYQESDVKDTLASYFDSFSLNQELTTKGSGINFKIGLIYKPIDWFRVGAAIHTPTFFSLHDEWSSTIKSYYDNGDNYYDDSPTGSFDYKLYTPMRAIGSIAFVVKGVGILSADYELVNYSESRLRSVTEKFFDENNNIQDEYTVQHNIRVGAEAALGMVSLRGGCAFYGSPYSSDKINDASRIYYSGGVGIIDNNYFLDLGYVYSKAKEDYYLYGLANAAKTTKTTQSFIITLGYKF